MVQGLVAWGTCGQRARAEEVAGLFWVAGEGPNKGGLMGMDSGLKESASWVLGVALE